MIFILIYIFVHNSIEDITFKYLLMLLPAILISSSIFEDTFSKYLYIGALGSLILSLIAFLFGFGIDYSYANSGRLQGFVSEPSALSLPIMIVFIISILNKSIYLLIFSIISAYLTKSPTVWLSIIIIFLIYKFVISNKYGIKFLSLILVLILFYNIVPILNFIYNYTDMRIFLRLSDGIQSLYSFGVIGYNPRVDEFIFFINNYISLLGYGVDTPVNGMRVWPIHLEVIYGFGLLGWLLFIILSYLTLSRLKKYSKYSMVLFLSIFVYSTINSAQGITYTYIYYTYLLFYIKSLNIRILRESNEKNYVTISSR